MSFKKSLLIVFLLLLIDQAIKVWVKLNMYVGEEIFIFGDWARIHFTENKGMAFGFVFGGDTGKLALSIFRLIAISGLIWYLFKITKEKLPKIAIFSIALVLAGAIGNMVDSAFYGLIFSESNFHTQNIAEFMPPGGGYESFMYGSVVDMLYFPMFNGHYPTWLFGGREFTFFSPVFNAADSMIFIGVVLIIIFRKKFIKSL